MQGVIYFHHGAKHSVRLVVSLYSLRRVYQGPVAILDSGEPVTKPILECLRADKRLNVSIKPIPLERLKRNTAYVGKASLWRHSPFDVSLLIDADTVVRKDPSRLLEFAATGPGFVVTRFSNWHTAAGAVAGRVQRWKGITDSKVDIPRLVSKTLGHPYAAINTGVVAWRDKAPILSLWERVTKAGARTPFTDELACQLLCSEHEHVLVTERYNWSPIYGRAPLDEVVIVHCHGHKECRPEAWPIFGPLFRECWEQNMAGVRDWGPSLDAKIQEYMVLLRG
jgi:hypothetical protein